MPYHFTFEFTQQQFSLEKFPCKRKKIDFNKVFHPPKVVSCKKHKILFILFQYKSFLFHNSPFVYLCEKIIFYSNILSINFELFQIFDLMHNVYNVEMIFLSPFREDFMGFELENLYEPVLRMLYLVKTYVKNWNFDRKKLNY